METIYTNRYIFLSWTKDIITATSENHYITVIGGLLGGQKGV